MSVTVQQVAAVLTDLAPEHLAEEWDNVGLLVGDPAGTVARVLVTLDVTAAVLDEAAAQGCEMIVAHHPVIFRPLARLRPDDPASALAYEAARRGVHLYAAHTNLDHAAGGTSDALAARLGVLNPRVLVPRTGTGDYKLVVFTPPEAVDAVIAALAEAGAGRIGAYSHCTFRSPGTGTYLPLAGAQPYAGTVGQLEQAEELRLETVVPRARLGPAISAMIAAHPYEEVAYDVYRLENDAANAGAGRIGPLPEPMTLGQFAAHVQAQLNPAHCRVVGDPHRPVKMVAVLGGSGGSFLDAAHRAGADVFVTGDLKHHEALHALALGLAVIDAGHDATERPVLARLVETLREKLPGLDEVRESAVRTEPFGRGEG